MIKCFGNQRMGLTGRDIEEFRDVPDCAFAEPVHFECDFHPLRQFSYCGLHGTHFIPVDDLGFRRRPVRRELFKDSIERGQDMARLSGQAPPPIESEIVDDPVEVAERFVDNAVFDGRSIEPDISFLNDVFSLGIIADNTACIGHQLSAMCQEEGQNLSVVPHVVQSPDVEESEATILKLRTIRNMRCRGSDGAELHYVCTNIRSAGGRFSCSLPGLSLLIASQSYRR
jgi:hypothetical protein